MMSAPSPSHVSGASAQARAFAAWKGMPEASSLVFDTELGYVVAPCPALSLHGLTSTDLEGRPAKEALPPERWQLFEPLYRAALKGKTGSVDIASPDKTHWSRVQVGPLRDEKGWIVGGVSSAVDITALRRAEERTRILLEAAPEAMVAVDDKGVIQLANVECERLFGYPPEALIGAPVEKLMPERYQNPHRNHRAGFTHAPGFRPMGTGLELLGRHQDGGEFPIDVSLSSLETDEGLVVTAVIRDLRAEGRLADSLSLLERLQSTAPVGLVFVDRDFRVQRINDTLAAVNGAPVEDQLGRPVADLVPAIWPQLEPAYRQVLESGEAVVNQDVTLTLPVAPDRVRTFLTTFYPVRIDGELIGIGAVAVDVTERREAQEFREAVMDNMAEGVYTQDDQGRLTYMNAAATRMLGFSEDELLGKSMHDAVHHQHADGSNFPAEDCELLRGQAEGQRLRKSEDAFTRKDGEIFPTAYSASPLRVGASERGLVVVFRDTSAEQSERTRVQRELKTLTWVGRIRESLDEDRLELYSQPIIPLGDGSPSEELLIRMLGRDGEVIPPGDFLPVAEKYGLIGEIDRWVITQAVRLAADGRHVAANLSAATVANPDLVSVIAQQLRDAKADPSKLDFELTESALMDNLAEGETFTRGLADMGCSLALDDFGTGFGSLTYLKRFPFSYLKIDIEFVRGLPTSKANQHVVKGIVNLAQGFGQRTIAEGVEDAETLQLLRDFGVDFAQGFYTGRPAPLTPPALLRRAAWESAPGVRPELERAHP
jgi:PAS domain S-box-containing protein